MADAVFERETAGPQSPAAKQLRPGARGSGRYCIPPMHVRCRRLHPPAQARRRKVRKAIAPQQVKLHTMALGREDQPPRGGEIERFGIARQFPDDEGQRAASYALLHCPQRIGRVARLNMDEPMPPRDRQPVQERASAPPDALRILHPQPVLCVSAVPQLRFGKGERQRLSTGIVHARKQLPHAGRQIAFGRPLLTRARERRRQVRRTQGVNAIGDCIIGLQGKDIGIGHGMDYESTHSYVPIMFSPLRPAIKPLNQTLNLPRVPRLVGAIDCKLARKRQA